MTIYFFLYVKSGERVKKSIEKSFKITDTILFKGNGTLILYGLSRERVGLLKGRPRQSQSSGNAGEFNL